MHLLHWETVSGINDEYRGAEWREGIKDKAIMSFGQQNVIVDEFV